MGRVNFIARKEFYHILRDPRSLVVVFAMPVMMTFLYGFAVNLDIENVTLAIIDKDQTPVSRALADDFYNSTYFSPPEMTVTLADPESALKARDAAGVLIIRPGFGAAVELGETFELGLMIDGSDNLLGAAVQAFSNGVVNDFMQERLPPGVERPGIRVSQQVLYNPDLKSSHFFVPAIVAIILIMISALLTSVTIAREKETGTMEQLLVAPVTPGQILIGKILPYIAIAFIDGMLVLFFAKLVFGVPFVGSMLQLMVFTMIYVSASLSIGILISSLVSTQQVAMMFALVSTMLPSIMLSGFIFPIKNMPMVLQAISYIVPARYYIEATRGIMLKGAAIEVLLPQLGALVALMLVLLIIATRKFKARIG
ncbi:ABC transporter permease subunit [candidate division GN15 bacterium]|nr:ABC transporter permease subunit [candidate division GN15 bacterium]